MTRLRRTRQLQQGGLIFGLLALCLAPVAGQVISTKELVLYNGKIITVDKSFSIQQALAIRGDRIIAVGTNQAVLARVSNKARRVDLKGKTVIPGLIENHVHLLTKSAAEYYGVSLALADSVPEMLELIRQRAEKTPRGELVYTIQGWYPEQFIEKRPPTLAELDAVSAHHPVICQGEIWYVNSLMLKKAGITKDTPNPVGGIIEKDPMTGQPTGKLEGTARDLAMGHRAWTRSYFLDLTPAQKLEALRWGQKELHAVGITSIMNPSCSPEDMRLFQELWRKGELTLRVGLGLDLDPGMPAETLIQKLSEWGVTSGFGNDMLWLEGVSEFNLDGGMDGMLFSQPYANRRVGEVENYYGKLWQSGEHFEQVARAMVKLGWRGRIHVAGDQALDIFLDALERINRDTPLAPLRWVMEHGHHTRPDQFPRIKALGLAISPQWHPYVLQGSHLFYYGKERADIMFRMRDWLDAGLTVGNGSDYSHIPPNPFWGLYFWITRDTRKWGPIDQRQRITRAEALKISTINNAWINFQEQHKGSLEEGKLADLLILSNDYLTVPEKQIRDLKPLVTMVGGKVVYQAADAPIKIQ